MKKTIIFILLFATGFSAFTQNVRLNLYGAYVFDDGYSSYYDNNNYYSGKIDGGFQGGAGIEYMVTPRYCVELMYLRRSTHAPTTYQAGALTQVKNTNFDLNLNYILLGGDGHMFSASGKAEGYGGLFAGVVISDIDNPENSDNASTTKFAWGARLGCNIWPAGKVGKVGIKLQAQLLSSVEAAGGSFYFGPFGSGLGLATYSTIYQLGLGGGLTYRLGK